MPLRVLDRTITSVAIVDDQEEARESYEDSVIDALLEPVVEVGPLGNLVEYRASLTGKADSLLCDYKLRVKNYAKFDGAELVAACYEQGYPAVLCTRFQDAQFEDIRAYRDRIPSLLDPDTLDSDALTQAFEAVVRELVEGPAPRRRPWRTQVHVVEVDDALNMVFVDLPGWHSSNVIRLKSTQLPPQVRIKLRPGYRCHAQVNIGAEETHELFFKEWEEA